MQSGYGIPEFQQFLIDGGSSLLSMSQEANGFHPQKLHLHDQNQQQLLHLQRFYHLHPNSAAQPFFQHPFQLQLLQQQQQQQQQRTFYQQLVLEQESRPENHSNSSSRSVGGGGVLPFVVTNFKLPEESSGCREVIRDEEAVLLGSAGDSRAAAADHQRWQRHREDNASAIKEPFWIPLDTEFINRSTKRSNESGEIYPKFEKEADKGAGNGQGKTGSASNYGLFRELEAIYTHGSITGSGSYTNQTGSSSALTGDNQLNNLTAVPEPAGDPATGGIEHMTSETSTGDEASLKKTEQKNKRKKRKRMQLSSLAFFLESLVTQLMAHQENLHKKFLEVMEKRDEQRSSRDEAWRHQEREKSKREAAERARELALASSREAAIVSFLEKITGETINLPAKPQLNSPMEENAKHDSDAFNSEKNSSRRWPKAEVHALIRARIGLESRFQEPGLKGPLWEEVSSSMAAIGYQRSARRCKEKWENINKYFRKTKDSAKKRAKQSKTCPYFQELDQLYSKCHPSKPYPAKDSSELLDAIVIPSDKNPSPEFGRQSFKFPGMGAHVFDFDSTDEKDYDCGVVGNGYYKEEEDDEEEEEENKEEEEDKAEKEQDLEKV